MKITKEIVDLITKLESIIAHQCYNPNSYNGWTGESGCSFRYPVYYCKNSSQLKKREANKESCQIKHITPDCIGTIK